ncbi:hypothetical protein [Chromobacterium vaccinii]|uniref:hypothetical protein n=1 Tax=Chromobacterium vaccinii TaxID=1108595 RepID=UPI001E490A9E|nr:hypothetical protein [Chromobacterium vaccinii]MCD4500487.1 hypothetical protein [Chromobacterium vaccinii]
MACKKDYIILLICTTVILVVSVYVVWNEFIVIQSAREILSGENEEPIMLGGESSGGQGFEAIWR